MGYTPFTMPFQIDGSENIQDLALKLKKNLAELEFYVNQMQVYENKVGVPTNEVVIDNKEAWTNMAVNYNLRNDRNGVIPAVPTFAGDGTAIDHTLNTDGSVNISIEWSYVGEGDSHDIDGFCVLVRMSDVGDAYSFGTTPAEEQLYYVSPEKNAFILYGVPADKYYHFGVFAYRLVDQDISPSGVLKSSVAKSPVAGESPYMPSNNVAFTGDITGTIKGVAASTLVQNVANSVQQGEAYSNVIINNTDGVKASHANGDYTKLNGGGLTRQITIPAQTKFEGFEGGVIPAGWTTASIQENGSPSTGTVTVAADYKNTGSYSLKLTEAEIYCDTYANCSVYVPVDSVISFYARVDFPATYAEDSVYADFYIDGVRHEITRQSVLPSTAWARFEFPISAGAHVFQWVLESSWTETGINRGRAMWIDDITFYTIAEQTMTAPYRYLFHAGEVSVSDETIDMDIPIALPPEFAGKDFQVVLSTRQAGSNWIPPETMVFVQMFETKLVGIDKNSGTFKVRSKFVENFIEDVIYNNGNPVIFMGVCGFTYIAFV